jgi:hypothetical protein
MSKDSTSIVPVTPGTHAKNNVSILPSKRRDSRAISFAENQNIFNSLASQNHSQEGAIQTKKLAETIDYTEVNNS